MGSKHFSLLHVILAAVVSLTRWIFVSEQVHNELIGVGRMSSPPPLVSECWDNNLGIGGMKLRGHASC